MRRLCVCGAAWLGLGLPLGCGSVSSQGTPPRLVLLYAPCTVNRSFLSPYDEKVGYTPHLSAFAREAVTFRRHQTEAG